MFKAKSIIKKGCVIPAKAGIHGYRVMPGTTKTKKPRIREAFKLGVGSVMLHLIQYRHDKIL